MEKNFFVQKEIKKLRKFAGGDTYIIIFLKLQLLSLENNQAIYFDGLENNFADEIALAIDEDVENVNVTLAYLLRIGWIEEIATNEATFYKIIKIDVGSEASSAARVRKHRQNKKIAESLQCNIVVTDSNNNVTIEEQRRQDLEIEQQQKHELCFVVNNSHSEQSLLSELCHLKIPEKTALSFLHEYGFPNVQKQIINLKNSSEVRSNVKWLHKALKNNYELPPSAESPSADPDCQKCHGTGKIEFQVDDTGDIISRSCSCLQRWN